MHTEAHIKSCVQWPNITYSGPHPKLHTEAQSFIQWPTSKVAYRGPSFIQWPTSKVAYKGPKFHTVAHVQSYIQRPTSKVAYSGPSYIQWPTSKVAYNGPGLGASKIRSARAAKSARATNLGLTRTVHVPVYDRIFGDFPAKITVYTPYIYGFCESCNFCESYIFKDLGGPPSNRHCTNTHLNRFANKISRSKGSKNTDTSYV